MDSLGEELEDRNPKETDSNLFANTELNITGKRTKKKINSINLNLRFRNNSNKQVNERYYKTN